MITKGIKELCDEAEKEVQTIKASEAIKLYDNNEIQLVDIRDIREL